MFDFNNCTSDKIYQQISPEKALQEMNDFISLINKFLENSKLNACDVEWNDALLMKIILRVDQRSDYFTYFHSVVDHDTGNVRIDKMSEYKRIALFCFWIIKYKPLRVKTRVLDDAYYMKNRCTVNETFAAYLFVGQLIHAKTISKEQKKYYISPAYIKDLYYKFMHHDISKEAMIFVLCSLVCCK